MPDWHQNWRQLGQQIGGTDQWLRRWSIMLSAQKATTGGYAGFLPKDVATSVGEHVGSVPGLPTSQIEAGTGFVLTSDDQPADRWQPSGLHIKFNVRQANSNTPNTADITIYNLADQTAADLIDEFNYVVLQAGYQSGHFGVIFAGEIKQYKKGHESATDSYLRIFAGDGDRAVRESIANFTNPAGTTDKQTGDKLAKTLQPLGVTPGYVDPSAVVYPPHIRPDTQFGITADLMRDWANRGPKGQGAIWSVENGKINFTKASAYDPGEIVKLNSHSGLVGWPEITQDGVYVTCLINPAIKLRQRVQLDNTQINQYFTPGGVSGTPKGAMNNFTDMDFWSPVSRDGIYAAWVIDYEGDSHGQAWYQHMTCLVVDPSSDLNRAAPGGVDYGSAA
jgi:hypothetical protein